MKIGISVVTDSWQVTEPEDSDEPYSDRGETDGSITQVTARANFDGSYPYYRDGPFELDVKRGDTIYPVIVTYGTGDTFGRDGGQVEVMEVFDNALEALEFEDWLRGVDENPTEKYHSFYEEYKGKKYHIPWRGYFEWLQTIDVYPTMVK